MVDGDGREGKNVKQDPERLCPQLEAADQCDAVGDQRDDDYRADEIADRAGDAEAQFQRHRENDGLDGEDTRVIVGIGATYLF